MLSLFRFLPRAIRVISHFVSPFCPFTAGTRQFSRWRSEEHSGGEARKAADETLLDLLSLSLHPRLEVGHSNLVETEYFVCLLFPALDTTRGE